MSNKRQTRKKRNSHRARDQRVFANSRVWTWEGMPNPDTGMQEVTAQRITPFGPVELSRPMAQQLLDYPPQLVHRRPRPVPKHRRQGMDGKLHL